jgi:3-phenylpropionate/cinnamic acid dioxygenase small subunit
VIVVALAPSDMFEIHQLYAGYNHAVDDGDGDAFAACFVPEGRLGGDVDITGSEALVAFARAVPVSVPGIRHNATNILLAAGDDPDSASGKAYLTVMVSTNGQPSVFTTGKYVDTLRRTREGWRFVERSFSGDR